MFAIFPALMNVNILKMIKSDAKINVGDLHHDIIE